MYEFWENRDKVPKVNNFSWRIYIRTYYNPIFPQSNNSKDTTPVDEYNYALANPAHKSIVPGSFDTHVTSVVEVPLSGRYRSSFSRLESQYHHFKIRLVFCQFRKRRYWRVPLIYPNCQLSKGAFNCATYIILNISSFLFTSYSLLRLLKRNLFGNTWPGRLYHYLQDCSKIQVLPVSFIIGTPTTLPHFIGFVRNILVYLIELAVQILPF